MGVKVVPSLKVRADEEDNICVGVVWVPDETTSSVSVSLIRLISAWFFIRLGYALKMVEFEALI